jgi:DNA-binding MarR family transcriptional regulator
MTLYRPILEPLGLTHPQYLVMLALWQESPLRVRDLGDRLCLDSATLSPLLKRLEASGYLTRRRNADDERSLDVALTDAGRELREQALRVPGTVVERLGMPVAELERIRDDLTLLLEASRAATAPGAAAAAGAAGAAGAA